MMETRGWWEGESERRNRNVETRQRKATTPEDSLFYRENNRALSDGTQTRNILHTMQMLYQLSHQGSPAGQAKSFNLHIQAMIVPVLYVQCACT